MGPGSSKQVAEILQETPFSLPATPIQGVEVSLPDKFNQKEFFKHVFIVWSIRHPSSNWTRVSQGCYYIPTRGDIGAKLRVEVFRQEYYPQSTKVSTIDPSDRTTEIVDLDSRNSKIRSRLSSVHIDDFDRILLSSQASAPPSQFFEMNCAEYFGSGLIEYKKLTSQDLEKTIPDFQAPPTAAKPIREEIEGAEPGITDFWETSVRPDLYCYTKHTDLLFTSESRNPVMSLDEAWMGPLFPGLAPLLPLPSAAVTSPLSTISSLFTDDETFELDPNYYIASEDHLTVMSWHVSPPVAYTNNPSSSLSGLFLSPPWKLRCAQIASIILSRSPDIVCLQEVPTEGFGQLARALFTVYNGTMLTVVPPQHDSPQQTADKRNEKQEVQTEQPVSRMRGSTAQGYMPLPSTPPSSFGAANFTSTSTSIFPPSNTQNSLSSPVNDTSLHPHNPSLSQTNSTNSKYPPGYSLNHYADCCNCIFYKRSKLASHGRPIPLDMFEKTLAQSYIPPAVPRPSASATSAQAQRSQSPLGPSPSRSSSSSRSRSRSRSPPSSPVSALPARSSTPSSPDPSSPYAVTDSTKLLQSTPSPSKRSSSPFNSPPVSLAPTLRKDGFMSLASTSLSDLTPINTDASSSSLISVERSITPTSLVSSSTLLSPVLRTPSPSQNASGVQSISMISTPSSNSPSGLSPNTSASTGTGTSIVQSSNKDSSEPTMPQMELLAMNMDIASSSARIGLTEMRSLGMFIGFVDEVSEMQTPPLLSYEDELTGSYALEDYMSRERRRINARNNRRKKLARREELDRAVQEEERRIREREMARERERQKVREDQEADDEDTDHDIVDPMPLLGMDDDSSSEEKGIRRKRRKMKNDDESTSGRAILDEITDDENMDTDEQTGTQQRNREMGDMNSHADAMERLGAGGDEMMARVGEHPEPAPLNRPTGLVPYGPGALTSSKTFLGTTDRSEFESSRSTTTVSVFAGVLGNVRGTSSRLSLCKYLKPRPVTIMMLPTHSLRPRLAGALITPHYYNVAQVYASISSMRHHYVRTIRRPLPHSVAKTDSTGTAIRPRFARPSQTIVFVTSVLLFGNATFGEDLRFAQIVNLTRSVYFLMHRQYSSTLSAAEDASLFLRGVPFTVPSLLPQDASSMVSSRSVSLMHPFGKDNRIPIIVCGDFSAATLNTPTVRVMMRGAETSSHPSIRFSPVLRCLVSLPSFRNNPLEMRETQFRFGRMSRLRKEVERELDKMWEAEKERENVYEEERMREIDRRRMIFREYDRIKDRKIMHQYFREKKRARMKEIEIELGRELMTKEERDKPYKLYRPELEKKIDFNLQTASPEKLKILMRQRPSYLPFKTSPIPVFPELESVRVPPLPLYPTAMHPDSRFAQSSSSNSSSNTTIVVADDPECPADAADVADASAEAHLLPLSERVSRQHNNWDQFGVAEDLQADLLPWEASQMHTRFPSIPVRIRDPALNPIFDPHANYEDYYHYDDDENSNSSSDRNGSSDDTERDAKSSKGSRNKRRRNGKNVKDSKRAKHKKEKKEPINELDVFTGRAKVNRTIPILRPRRPLPLPPDTLGHWFPQPQINPNTCKLRLHSITPLAEEVGEGAAHEARIDSWKGLPPYFRKTPHSALRLYSHEFEELLPWIMEEEVEEQRCRASAAEGRGFGSENKFQRASGRSNSTPSRYSHAIGRRGFGQMNTSGGEGQHIAIDMGNGLTFHQMATYLRPRALNDLDDNPLALATRQPQGMAGLQKRSMTNFSQSTSTNFDAYYGLSEDSSLSSYSLVGLLTTHSSHNRKDDTNSLSTRSSTSDTSFFKEQAQFSPSNSSLHSLKKSSPLAMSSQCSPLAAPKIMSKGAGSISAQLSALSAHPDHVHHPSLPFGSEVILFRIPIRFIDAWSHVTKAPPAHTMYLKDGERTISAPSDYVFTTNHLHPILVKLPRLENETEADRDDWERIRGASHSSEWSRHQRNRYQRGGKDDTQQDSSTRSTSQYTSSGRNGKGRGGARESTEDDGTGTTVVTSTTGFTSRGSTHSRTITSSNSIRTDTHSMSPSRPFDSTDSDSSPSDDTTLLTGDRTTHGRGNNMNTGGRDRFDRGNRFRGDDGFGGGGGGGGGGQEGRQRQRFLMPLCLFPSSHRPVFTVYHRFWEDPKSYAKRMVDALKAERGEIEGRRIERERILKMEQDREREEEDKKLIERIREEEREKERQRNMRQKKYKKQA
ncbi:uncharacterized protein MONOS_404 [Monocercomonoides exilis]|uniref:uncharacterized protein n=1 Tax=Monocercomonoides exilis TaxID=2049356 RepID=UPI00355A0E69|nr:hypothetical protein MONOS_404 [Monocercomonoides exilis]|eukprot:MONOS_404.1-p1 / transcript=MONOS_404.1 / gene=MONOS_404 / organism=Monocercomonoides_exilis_PA203 / gene_product=unspecified product / transcript_product=unspecified product / location=Mono_scaffold00006:252840-259588(-) / protein_length=2213 / sequence_SO=supercontig / SO=protein_coding / is_pseudo=false